jgi:hypothetical protein
MKNFEGWKKDRMKELETLCSEMKVHPWENREFYAAWLSQTYFYVCHSTRLLAAAAARFGVDQDELHLRFAAHMGEESRHEALALKDLEFLSFSPKEVGELPATAAFYQSQYYLIDYKDPRALLGYILMLEGLAVLVGPSLYNVVKKTHGPKSSLFVKVHAEEDIGHVEEAFKAIERLDDKAMEMVSISFEQSRYLYKEMLASCLAWSNSLNNLSRRAA